MELPKALWEHARKASVVVGTQPDQNERTYVIRWVMTTAWRSGRAHGFVWGVVVGVVVMMAICWRHLSVAAG